MCNKFLYVLIVILFILILFGCKKEESKNVVSEKDLKATSCKELLTLIKTWEKEENIGINFSFNKNGTGEYVENKIRNNFAYTISENSLTIELGKQYSLSCDLINNTITLSNEKEINTFVIKGTQIYKDLVGVKNSELKGTWSSAKEVIVLNDKNNSSHGKIINNIYEVKTYIDWINLSKNILIIQDLSNGKEREYTYELKEDKLKLFYDNKIVDIYVKEK